MSEQTPNSSEDLSGAEPSMEDILASIRKIISEDEPVAMESPEDVQVDAVADLTSDAVRDVSASSDVLSAEGDSVDLNIDDVLADMDIEAHNLDASDLDIAIPDIDAEIASPVSADAIAPVVAAPVISAAATAEDIDDDILGILEDDIPLEDDVDVIAPIEAEATQEPVDEVAEALGVSSLGGAEEAFEMRSVPDDADEMDALLDDILMVSEETSVEDSIASEPEVSAVFSSEPASVGKDPDLELVKSLMADLSDDPEKSSTDDDLESLLELPELDKSLAEEIDLVAADVLPTEGSLDDLLEDFALEETPVVSDLTEVADATLEDSLADLSDGSTEEEDILGDILDMTLEDELNAQPDEITSIDEILELEQANLSENSEIDLDAMMSDEAFVLEEIDALQVETPDVDVTKDDLPSLADIAAAAEADAVEAETSPLAAASIAAAGTGAAALGAIVSSDTKNQDAELSAGSDDGAEAVTQVEPEIETPTQQIHNQETPMPVKAVTTDAILDDVTETATAGAFAELNQIVEDKAIFNERGPRIGDLVQEALRPMLKEWLDANLKGIVERAVTKEVKRISSGK